MPNFVGNAMAKDTGKAKELFDTLVEQDDLTFVNPKAEKAIKNKAIVPPSSITEVLKSTNDLKREFSEILFYQKWYTFAKALIAADDPVFNAIISDKLGYSEVENESEIEDNAQMYRSLKLGISEDGEELPNDGRLPDEELKLTGRAITLANEFISRKNFREHFGKPGIFNAIVEQAEKKDPSFMKKATDEVALNMMLTGNRVMYFNSLEKKFTKDYIVETPKDMRTKSQIEDLKAENEALIEKVDAADRELTEKQRISDMQKERNGKSALWFIFRPISNLVNYIKLNNAKKDFKNNFILPKLDKFKGAEDYESKVEQAVNQFNEEIVSDGELKATASVKKYTAEELEQTDFDEIEGKNPNDPLFTEDVEPREDFQEKLKGEFERRPSTSLNASISDLDMSKTSNAPSIGEK